MGSETWLVLHETHDSRACFYHEEIEAKTYLFLRIRERSCPFFMPFMVSMDVRSDNLPTGRSEVSTPFLY
jgi:hypothetical protein